MIVRISTEGQYRVNSAALDRLNEIDAKLMVTVEENNEIEFCRLLGELLDVVRREGRPVPIEEIVESDIVLPPPDTSIEEARHLFQPDGLVPG
jgi:hypothetical protein